MWAVSGEADLESMEYGAAYEGLVVEIEAEALTSKASYRVSAKELEWPNPIGYSSARFDVDERGAVHHLVGDVAP